MIVLSIGALVASGVAGFKAIEYILDNGVKGVTSEIYNGREAK